MSSVFSQGPGDFHQHMPGNFGQPQQPPHHMEPFRNQPHQGPQDREPLFMGGESTRSLDKDYKALLAYLTLFDITSGSLPTGYAASFLEPL